MKKLSIFIVMFAFSGLNEAICQWNTSGNNIYNTNTGNVGIGNTSPSTLLYVGKSMTEPTITVRNYGGTGGATYSMIDDASGANWKFKATMSGGFKIRDHANSLDVITIEPNSAANSLYIRSGGSVSIGTDIPYLSDKLSVIQSTGSAIYAHVSGAGANAVYGYASATTGTNYAVRALHKSNAGAAGFFLADENSGACAGVFGRADGNVLPGSCAVAGFHFYGGIGVGAWSYEGDLIRGYAGSYPGGTLRFYITNAGVVYADGGFNTFKKVMLPEGKHEYRTFNSIQSTESWIEDLGSAELLNGEAIVSIDPVFTRTVDLKNDYKVFLTPVSEEMVLLVVTNKSPDKFTVRGITFEGREVSCSFDYRIVAKDSEKRDSRMEIVDIPETIEVARED